MLFRKPNNQMLHHVAEILRIMQETAPDGAQIEGFQFNVLDGQVQNILGSARVGADLAHIRPGVHSGWRINRLRLVSV